MGHLYHGYVSHNQRVYLNTILGAPSCMAVSHCGDECSLQHGREIYGK